MAKSIKWQIPFVSNIEKTKYRIDIYAEGYTGNPIQLTAGPQPFVTEENKSDDFFTPVRSQTGTLQVCTAIPGGGTLKLEDILPANNIAHPVRLVSIAANNTETIEWQGFLSCEAYSQRYTSIPEVLTIPVISVLEAMDSVQLDMTRSSGLVRIRTALYYILDEIRQQCDTNLSFFTYINYSLTDWRIFNKYIDQTLLFERKEYNNENYTTYIVSGLSAKDALERLCTFMGWTAREQGTELYLERLCEKFGMARKTLSDFQASAIPEQTGVDVVSEDIDDFIWRDSNHKKNVKQGAKTVEVIANLEKYQLYIQLPAFPVGDTTVIYRQLWKYNGNGDWLYLVANQNLTAYSNIQFGFYAADLRYMYFHFENYGTTTLAQALSHMSVGTDSSAVETIQGQQLGLYRWYAGAFLSRYCWENSGSIAAHDTKDALYCIFFPHSLNFTNNPDLSETTDFSPAQVGPIFSINNITYYRCNVGYLRLNARTDTIFMWPSSNYTGADLKHSTEQANDWFIGMELQFGTKWWNGASWQNSQCTFKARMREDNFKKNWVDTMPILETDGYLIPITEEMYGLVTLNIWPMASPTSYSESNTGVLEMIFSSLSVEHILPVDNTQTDRGENHYFRLLGTNFSDEISINTDLASYLNNEQSPSIIMTDATTPATTIDYKVRNSIMGELEPFRPEVDLLNRMASYYIAARQTLELKVQHPTAAALPLLKLNGISPDTKKYLPLAESRDWKGDVSTLKCFETPDEALES